MDKYLQIDVDWQIQQKQSVITEGNFPGPLSGGSYDPFKVQVGGDHYKNFVIQPGEFINKNKLTWYEGNAVKYITRSRFKGNLIQDLEKAKHYIDLAIAEWKAGNVESK